MRAATDEFRSLEHVLLETFHTVWPHARGRLGAVAASECRRHSGAWGLPWPVSARLASLGRRAGEALMK